jgi:hypothetical protein
MEPKLIHGDCLLVMRELVAESVHRDADNG